MGKVVLKASVVDNIGIYPPRFIYHFYRGVFTDKIFKSKPFKNYISTKQIIYPSLYDTLLDPGFEEAKSNVIFQMSQISEIKSFTKSNYFYANLPHFEELEAIEIKQKNLLRNGHTWSSP